ncbi:substrate-binding domain-containing protein [Blastococcus goldschmidtiae]|uniref:Substrate-binding domain-containing protein n=1 Tax=Blastococcus goldschmidtiae TaxID=3075546 RepID=A0ABU2K7N8_9ACTN|nr:substrate-binding domain-containing protein [Blastococcus sp. DSM 46792]MDT0276200.1 substrate-binding domain-containing protein [Blastococcus sp. DSM 46792]
MRRRTASRLLPALLAPVLLATACGGGDDTDTGGSGGQADGEPIPVGIVTSLSGPLSSYGEAYVEGLDAGLDYATDGTGACPDGRPIEIETIDDGGDPEQAVSAATDLVGRGVTVLGGTASSGVAVQLAPFAEENDILYLSGAAASDAITGINDNTFRAGRQTYQDVATAATLLENASGDVLVFAQDTEFGQGNVAAVEAVLGDEGATVDSLLVPASANEFTPFAQQINDAAPDLLFVAWAGDTTSAMWQALQQQGVFDRTTVTTGLGDLASWPAYGEEPQDINFLAHYVSGTTDNEAADAMEEAIAEPDLFTPDGFVTAQMVVRAVCEGDPADTASMIEALEGWEFQAPKGMQTIRASDHAMIQPMFTAQLTGPVGERVGEVLSTVPADEVAPPEGS